MQDSLLPFPEALRRAVLGPVHPERLAQLELQRAGLTDGLPVVVPTDALIDEMLADRNPLATAIVGPLPIAFTVPIWWELAACAVLAGCPRPPAPGPGDAAPGYRFDLLDVIAAALDAAADEAFNLLGVQTTTGAASPLVIVHGPIVEDLGFNAGTGVMGPASPINATVGRAVRLCLQNIGLARIGEADMATHGHPGKYSWLLAENHARSPWPPFSTVRGLAPEVAAVTVLAGVGNVEVVLPTMTPDQLADRLAQVLAGLAAPEAVLALPPDGAQFLHRHGWQRDDLLDALDQRGIMPPLVVVTGGAGVKATLIPGWGGPTTAVTRALVRRDAEEER